MLNVFKNFAKFSLAFGLIYWLVESGKIDFSLLKKTLESPMVIILVILMMLLDHFIVAVRLKIILLKKAQEKLSLIKIFVANWIGIFFNSVLPGAVTGDIIKIFYLEELDKKLDKKFLLVAVFMDRVIGLIGLILIGGIVCIFNYNLLVGLSKEVSALVHFNLIFTLLIMMTLFILFFFKNFPHQIAKPFRNIKYLGSIVKKLEIIWNELTIFKENILKLISLSMIIQGVAMLIFWYITRPYAEGDLSIATIFTILPAGFISLAIPISPGGLGVGHVVFHKLFGFFGITNGADLFNIYFFFVLITNLTGVIPYIFYKKKKKLKN